MYLLSGKWTRNVVVTLEIFTHDKVLMSLIWWFKYLKIFYDDIFDLLVVIH